MTQQTNNAQQVVAPTPVGMTFRVSTVPIPETGEQLVGLTILSPTGQFVAFIDPDGAEGLADHLAQAATRARTGLIVASGMADAKGAPSK